MFIIRNKIRRNSYLKEKFGDTKRGKSNGRQQNGQTNKIQKDKQRSTQKITDRATLKTGV
jgi:hypothetical protein